MWAVSKCLPLYVADLAFSGLSLLVAATLRFGLVEPNSALLVAVPLIVAICAVVFPLSGLYERNWRYTSIPDLVPIGKAVVLASSIFISFMFLFTRLDQIPRSVIAIGVLILFTLLTGIRLSFRVGELRAFGSSPSRSRPNFETIVPILLIGAGNSADHYLRALQRDSHSSYWPVGILDDAVDQQGLLVRGVPVLGSLGEFESAIAELALKGQKPRHIIFTKPLSSFQAGAAELLFQKADKRGLAVSRLPSPTELRKPTTEHRFELRPIELTDLLERPQTALDLQALLRLVGGRRVLITGAGGSIGGELTQQIAALGPSELILVESCEYNLYAIDLELSEKFPRVPRWNYLCNIRDVRRVNQIFDQHAPQLVFHAAALKHVPMVEANACEGVLTNVIGTKNIAEATKRARSLGMVMISSDKVVNSTSVMGMTKRLAELYCQACDINSLKSGNTPRFMTVRFGNVMGSSGSLIPLFKRQLLRGGPLTVTHPEMRRFFMTLREAVELTLQASAYGLERQLGQGEIFVLDMGEPIKIIDIARRMISLAGYTPDVDIKIDVVGCRPGEKLFEELFDVSEKRVNSSIPGVLGAVPDAISLSVLQETFLRLRLGAEMGDVLDVLEIAMEIIPSYKPSATAQGPHAPGQTAAA